MRRAALLGADPDSLETVASAMRGAGRSLREISGRGIGAKVLDAWWGADGQALARRLRRSVDRPLREVAADLEGRAAELVAAAREQRRASESRPRPVLVAGSSRQRGTLVQRIGPSRAEHVVVLVPGVGTDRSDRRRLAEDASEVWSALNAAEPGSGRHPGGVSVLSWLGYDPPDTLPAALDLAPASRGAEVLVDRVAVLRSQGADRVTVVGHSYGGLVVGRALELGLRADTAVLLGAPGSGSEDGHADRADVLVAAAVAPGDPIAFVHPLGRLLYGTRPTEGAVVLPTSRSGHSAYLEDPVLLDALATIATAGPGRYGHAAGAGAGDGSGGMQWEPR